MGKVQCKTSNNKDLIEIIEQKMRAKDTSLDSKIEKEYYTKIIYFFQTLQIFGTKKISKSDTSLWNINFEISRKK